MFVSVFVLNKQTHMSCFGFRLLFASFQLASSLLSSNIYQLDKMRATMYSTTSKTLEARKRASEHTQKKSATCHIHCMMLTHAQDRLVPLCPSVERVMLSYTHRGQSQLCSLRLLKTDSFNIVRIQFHDLQTIRQIHFCFAI